MSMAMPEGATPQDSSRVLAEPDLRRALERFVRRRVPSSEVEDVVQTVLVEALASAGRPGDPAEVRRWVMGIARHKVADFHRRGGREHPEEALEVEATPAPVEAREMVRWAEQQAQSTRDAGQTLEWMAREGEGEKLETIAAEEEVPAARVRQRVSRMRKWMRERWLAELAAVAALGLLLVIAWRWVRSPPMEETPVADATVRPEASTAVERAVALRREAFELCDEGAHEACLLRLDDAKILDPAGDGAPRVGAARARAMAALEEDASKRDPEQRTPNDDAPEPTPTLSPSAPPSVAPTYQAPAPQKQSPKKQAPNKPLYQDDKNGQPFDGKEEAPEPEQEPKQAPKPQPPQNKQPSKPLGEPMPQQQMDPNPVLK